MSDSVEVTAEDLESLGAKIDGLELSDAERAIMDEVFERAAAYEPEVEGFAQRPVRFAGQRSGAGLAGSSFTLGLSAGFIMKVEPPKNK